MAQPTGSPSTADPSADAEARAHYQAGQLAFDQGRFENALESFRMAYALSQRPELLYTIASAADRLRQDAVALDAFERYLELVPDSPHANSVRARIGLLQRSVADANRSDEPAPTHPPSASETSPQPERAVEMPIASAVEVEPRDLARPSLVAPLTLTVIGAALTVGGGIGASLALHCDDVSGCSGGGGGMAVAVMGGLTFLPGLVWTIVRLTQRRRAQTLGGFRAAPLLAAQRIRGGTYGLTLRLDF